MKYNWTLENEEIVNGFINGIKKSGIADAELGQVRMVAVDWGRGQIVFKGTELSKEVSIQEVIETWIRNHRKEIN